MNGELSGGKNGAIYERTDSVRLDTHNSRIKPAPMKFSVADIVLAFGMLIIGFLYWNLISLATLGFGVTLFALILCVVTASYFRASGLRQSRESLGFLCITILSALNFTIFDGVLIKGFNFIFLSLSFVYWVCLTAGKRLEEKISLYLISDMLRQLFVIPFGNFTGCFSGVRQTFVKSRKGKGILSGALGILFFLPVLLAVIMLLSSADAAFEIVMDHIKFSFSENMLEYFGEFLFGVPVACYLYGLIYGNRYQRNVGDATLESVNRNLEAFRFAPGVTVYSAMTALNLVYIIFFLAQTTYFFAAFSDNLPQTMTYAEYARRGFFELCTVSAINLAVITVAHLIAKRDNVKVLRGETTALCIFTIALIITAISKMGMYISYYGLTQLRVYTSWFMVLMLICFVIILVRQFKSFHGTKLATVCFLLLFFVLCYGNLDGMIAKYNIDRYKAGTLETLDLEAMEVLSDGAKPYLYQLYQETEDEELKTELWAAIREKPFWERDREMENSTFRDFNYQSYRAEQIRKELLMERTKEINQID